MNNLLAFLRKHLKQVIFIIIGLIFFALFFKFKLYNLFNREYVVTIKDFVLKYYLFGQIILILLYIIFNIFCLPTLQFNFFAGFLYGFTYGSLLAWIGMLLGLMASFINSRYLFRKDFSKSFGTNKMFFVLENMTRKYKGLAVLFFRVFFIIPYNFQNIGYGLTSIKIFQYFWGSALGIIPTTLFYAWLGNLISLNQINFVDIKNYSFIIGIVITIFAVIFFTSILLKKKFFKKNINE